MSRAPGAALVLVALLAAGAAVADVAPGTSTPAGAQSSSELWDRFERASAAHADAEEQLALVQAEVTDLGERLARKEAAAEVLQGDIRRIAVQQYVLAGDRALEPLSVTDATAQAYGAGLAEVVTGARSDTLDEYAMVAEDLERDRLAAQALEERRTAAVASAETSMAELRDAAQAAARMEQAAREAAARAAALREAQERAAAEAARRAAARARLATSRQPTARPGAPAARPPATTAPSAPAAGGDSGGGSTLDPNGLTEAQLAVLRRCEASGNYANTSNPRYRGAYQFHRRTWDGVALQAGRPDLVGVDPAAASPADQDAMAQALYRSAGLRPWPTCGRAVRAA